jgi:hypothetical protein
MINLKGCGRKCLWPNFKRLSQHLPGGSDENYEKPQDSQSGSRYDPRTFQTQSRRVNQSNTTFSKIMYTARILNGATTQKITKSTSDSVTGEVYFYSN